MRPLKTLVVAAGLALPALFAPVAPPALAASLAELRAETTDRDLYVSFHLREAFDEEARTNLSTGLPVTITYYLEVARRRPLWFDKTLVRKTVTTTAAYDTISRQYSLAKKVNDEVTETSVAVNEADMMRWMTHIERVRLADPALLDGVDKDSLYIRVKSRLRKRFVLFFIPWDVDTRWERIGLSPPGEGTSRAR